VPAGIWRYQLVCSQKILSAGILPIFVASGHTVKKKERVSVAFHFVVQLNSVNVENAHRSSSRADLGQTPVAQTLIMRKRKHAVPPSTAAQVGERRTFLAATMITAPASAAVA
jgi:hypothetical protein